METKKILILGAGISGLSAGIFGRLNGFETTILEMGRHAGGVCTSWDRNGYSVNGSLHWLIGSSPGLELHDMWQQLGIMEDSTFHFHDRFVEYRDIDGTDVHFYNDPDKLNEHLTTISPADEELIGELCSAIRALAHHGFPFGKSFELLTVREWTKLILSTLPIIPLMAKFTPMTIGHFASKFRSNVLRTAFDNFWSREMSMTFFLLQMALASKRQAGYLIGGSGNFSQKLVKRYESLGGTIEYGQKARGMLVEDHAVTGVETSAGEKHYADYVISACDGKSVLFDMLGDKYVDKKTRHAYQTLETFPSLIFFSAGINRTFDDVTPSIMGLNIPLKEPVRAGKYCHNRASFQIYNFDPTLAPAGRTLITALLHTDYEYWSDLFGESQEKYRAEQSSIRNQLIRNLEHYFQGITALVDFADVATPITYKNMTGNYRGSYEGWLPTPDALRVNLPSHFKSLRNFYMAGHWTKPGGGMPPSAASGRDAIHLICQKENKHFSTFELSPTSA